MKRSILVCMLVICGLSSCKKYPDGPLLSFLPKKMRLVNDWTLQQYLVDGVDNTSTYLHGITDFTYTLAKSGEFERKWVSNSGIYTDKGNWEFENHKEELKITYTTSSSTPEESFTILRLKNKELWLRKIGSGPVKEFHYRKK